MPKVSIIVPVYKAEKYLHRCVDSIIAQTFTDWELLLVDDGSPDRSGDICDEYARKDNRVRVFHKENGGVSSARNLGLDNINGEFVTFVDADDWIDSDNLSVCVSTLESNNLDVLQYSWRRIDENGNILQIRKIDTDAIDLPHYIEKGNFNVCVGGSYMKSSIIQNGGIRFTKNLKLAEDQVFILTVMSKAKRIQSFSNVYYNYFFNEESATNNTHLEDIINGIKALVELKKNFCIYENHCNKMILNFFIDALSKKNCNVSNLSKLFKYSDVNAVSVTDNHIKLLLILSHFNVRLALFALHVILIAGF